MRIHHCIGDGIALISVVLSITDGGSEPPSRKARGSADDAGDGDWLSDAVIQPLTDIAVKAIGMYGEGVARSMRGAVAAAAACRARSRWRASATRCSATWPRWR